MGDILSGILSGFQIGKDTFRSDIIAGIKGFIFLLTVEFAIAYGNSKLHGQCELAKRIVDTSCNITFYIKDIL